MKAIVLVGGEGTRLRPLTYKAPKQMLPIVEVPMLERVVTYLSMHGVDEVVLSLGYLPEAFEDAYPDGDVAGVKVVYAVEPELLDTAGAIRFAAESAGIDETFVAVNGDVLTDGDVSALVDFHSERGALATLYLSPVSDPSRFGVVPTRPDGQVIEFVEKPPPGKAPTNLINAGIYVMEADVLDLIPGGRRVSVERETFPALAAKGALYAMSDGAYWLDTGTPEAFLAAQADLLEGRRDQLPAPGALRAPGAAGCWTLGTPSIEGEVDAASLVGDGALVCPGAVVERSVIGARCRVDGGSRITGSVLMAGACVASNCVIESSIVGPGSSVGSGSSITGVSIVGHDVGLADGTQLVAGRAPESAPNLA